MEKQSLPQADYKMNSWDNQKMANWIQEHNDKMPEGTKGKLRQPEIDALVALNLSGYDMVELAPSVSALKKACPIFNTPRATFFSR